jgi:hypothetical protein
MEKPQMIRCATVRFASDEDRERARASFHSSQVLNSSIDIVPVRPPFSPPSTLPRAKKINLMKMRDAIPFRYVLKMLLLCFQAAPSDV